MNRLCTVIKGTVIKAIHANVTGQKDTHHAG